MKLFVLALCFCAAVAEVHWDESGRYRLIERTPVEMLQYNIAGEPLGLRINGPTDAKYRIVGAPIPEAYPLVYQYLNPGLPSTRLTSVDVKSVDPFVYSYKQVNKEV